jgi:hypothetical protein
MVPSDGVPGDRRPNDVVRVPAVDGEPVDESLEENQGLRNARRGFWLALRVFLALVVGVAVFVGGLALRPYIQQHFIQPDSLTLLTADQHNQLLQSGALNGSAMPTLVTDHFQPVALERRSDTWYVVVYYCEGKTSFQACFHSNDYRTHTVLHLGVVQPVVAHQRVRYTFQVMADVPPTGKLAHATTCQALAGNAKPLTYGVVDSAHALVAHAGKTATFELPDKQSQWECEY